MSVGDVSMAPLGFSKVQEGIYRSAYPATKALPFVEQLALKSLVCLSPNDIKPELERFCAAKDIQIFKFDLKHNQDPFLIMDEKLMQTIQLTLNEPENRPLLIFCTAGKIRTGCVVGCFRKHQNWSMSAIIAEFEQFTEPDGSLCDMHFIDAYEPLTQAAGITN